MNLGELRDTFRRDVKDTSTPYLFSDESIDEWINEAEEEACLRGRLIFDNETPTICEIGTTTDTTRYDLHESITELVHASITKSSGEVVDLSILDRREADRLQYDRRTLTQEPTAIIHHDTWIEYDCIPEADYTLNIEVYRTPKNPMANDGDTPEINARHHKRLLDWVKHKAFEIPDTDTMDLGRTMKYEARFERYFGKRPTADMRKRQNANTPHRNQAHW